MDIDALDIETAFLHGELKEEIYIKPPKGSSDYNTGVYWKLVKALYGLKQAGREFAAKVKETLQRMGYTNLIDEDECIYVRQSQSGKLLLFAVYVDDMVKACDPEDRAEMQADVEKLKSVFKLKELGAVSFILGIKVERDREAGIIRMSQEAYIERLLTDTQMLESKPVCTPSVKVEVSVTKDCDSMDTSDTRHTDTRGPQDCTAMWYRSTVGALIYLAGATRPDIAEATSALASKCSAPTALDVFAAKRVLRYLNGTRQFGLSYVTRCGSEPVQEALQLRVYSDSNWGNSDDGRSVSGMLAQIGDASVCWTSKKQSTVALSSSEAEYVAASEAARELVWLRRLCGKLQAVQKGATPMYVDNTTAISMIDGEGKIDRRKHINIKHHFIRDMLSEQELTIEWVPTAENSADIFTKPLERIVFCKHRRSVLGEDAE
jgi:hypothetical protein